MTIAINGASISEKAIERETQFHQDAPSRRETPRCALGIRELLLLR